MLDLDGVIAGIIQILADTITAAMDTGKPRATTHKEGYEVEQPGISTSHFPIDIPGAIGLTGNAIKSIARKESQKSDTPFSVVFPNIPPSIITESIDIDGYLKYVLQLLKSGHGPFVV